MADRYTGGLGAVQAAGAGGAGASAAGCRVAVLSEVTGQSKVTVS